MRCLDLSLPTPEENLAADEALWEGVEAGGAEVLRFWEAPAPFVVLGYANRAAREADLAACRARGVPVLRRVTGLKGEALRDLIARLRRLDPKPGARFARVDNPPVVPDIFVRRSESGWVVELNSQTLPRVLVNRRYHAELSAGAPGGVRHFLAECMASANWLMRALDQRARTITMVATELVRQQQGFFEQGVGGLRPLTLRQVASAVGLHESTASRATAHKYLACERGVFDLRYFFTPALASTEGERDVSTETVRRRIADLIAAETADSVLSDDQLVRLLNAEGFDVARRTVAKYRESLNIPTANMRKTG